LVDRDLILFSIDMIQFLNWFRTSCMVAIATVVTWCTWTANFWTDFKLCYRHGNKWVGQQLWARVKVARLLFKHMLQLLTWHTVTIETLF